MLHRLLLVSVGLALAAVVIGPSLPDTTALRPRSPADTTKPLRPLMTALAQDMDRIATGLWHEEYDLIRQGAQNIATHPRIPPGQIAAIKRALGDEFEGFVAFDKTVHGAAAELVTAAEARDWSAVLDTHARLQRGCVGCHRTYRERLRPVLSP